MKKYLYFIPIIIFMGCSNVKSIYNDESLDTNNQSVKYILDKLNAIESDRSIVYFTNGFEGDTIELVNGEDVIFKLPIETKPQLGLAYAKAIFNEKEVKINIQATKPVKILLNKKGLKKHKFIYISKSDSKKDQYLIEYSNLKRDFY
jgi:hypothetical protein